MCSTCRFAVNLLCGQYESSDIALHFNPRFDGRDRVVFNTCQNGAWGSEDKVRSMPFRKGKGFEMVIMVTSQGYKVRETRTPTLTHPNPRNDFKTTFSFSFFSP